MTDQSLSLAVKPIITYPREAQVGKTYLMTIDLHPDEGFEWQYEEEDYPIYCSVDSDLFSSKPVGEPVVILHRFGGSYGEAKFLLTAAHEEARGTIRIALVNARGVTVRNLSLTNVKTIQSELDSVEQLIRQTGRYGYTQTVRGIEFNLSLDESQHGTTTLASINTISIQDGIAAIANWLLPTVEDIFLEQREQNQANISQRLYFALEKYIKKYSEQYGILKVLGMRESIPLRNVYTKTRFLDASETLKYESIENLENNYRKINKHGFQRGISQNKTEFEITNEYQFLMVLGAPGAGKSILLRQLGIKILEKSEEYEHECIPVFLELKRFSPELPKIKEAIVQEFEVCSLPSSDQFTTKLLEEGKLLILLDGLSEVPFGQMSRIIAEIQNFVERYSKNRFIISCRTAAYNYSYSFKRFTSVEIANFDNSQIEQFTRKWFNINSEKQGKNAQIFWDLLQQSEYSSIKEIANSPLFLTFLCLVFERSQAFPEKRSALYRKAVDILLEEWAAERRISGEEIYRGLNADLEKVLLSEIAFLAFSRHQLFFTQRELTDHIKTFLVECLNAPINLDGRAVLDKIEHQHGILVKRAQDIYSFSHLTFQEYFTAMYIVDHNKISNLVIEHLSDKRWQEIFLLVAGLMRGADELLLKMKQEASTYINTSRLRELLQWAESVTSVNESSVQPATGRAIALLFALNRDSIMDLLRILNSNVFHILELARSSGIIPVRNLDHNYLPGRSSDQAQIKAIASNLVEELEKNRIFANIDLVPFTDRLEKLLLQLPSASQSNSLSQAYNEGVSEIYLNELKLDPTLLELTESELIGIDDYFYANYLIVRCKQSAVRLSPKSWARIEQQMLCFA
ncbi:NACHT domain-containing protein [Stenomitos frigidus]|uniref:Histidine kinase n=1 Tax=Stenomitos frigidus ULC18 TaxID=2107698 RepID=A0A2T1ELW4_9CYAN|nr:NACHT domain-containing protein [Stenomitos frigidus]PSB33714.1 histidine kinase [Stenomitos frigidus ULC18]